MISNAFPPALLAIAFSLLYIALLCFEITQLIECSFAHLKLVCIKHCECGGNPCSNIATVP
jgi:hypothetical protein